MATYYVDPENGDDGAGGTDPIADAWASLSHAFGQLSAGDTLYCRAGVTYPEKAYANILSDGTVDSPITVIFDTGGDVWGTSGDVTVDYGGSVKDGWVVSGQFWEIKQNGSGTLIITGATSSAILLNYYAARIRFWLPVLLNKVDIGVHGLAGGYAYFGYLDSTNITTATILSESHAVSIFVSNFIQGNIRVDGGRVELLKADSISDIRVSWGEVIVWDSGASQATVTNSTMVRHNNVHYNDYGMYLGQGYVTRSTDVSSPTGQPDVIKVTYLSSESGEGLIPFRWIWLPSTSGTATIHVYIRPSGIDITTQHFILHTLYKSSSTNIWRHETTEFAGTTYNADTWTDINYTTSQPVTAGVPITVYGEIPGKPSSAGSSFVMYIDTYFSVDLS